MSPASKKPITAKVLKLSPQGSQGDTGLNLKPPGRKAEKDCIQMSKYRNGNFRNDERLTPFGFLSILNNSVVRKPWIVIRDPPATAKLKAKTGDP